jgi:hypothetical protein
VPVRSAAVNAAFRVRVWSTWSPVAAQVISRLGPVSAICLSMASAMLATSAGSGLSRLALSLDPGLISQSPR